MTTSAWTFLWTFLKKQWPLVGGFVLLIAVGWQNLVVRNQNNAILDGMRHEKAATVAAGDWVGEISATSLEGRHVHYSTADGQARSLVIAMSLDCGFCDKNVPAWNRLSVAARRLGAQVVWVARDTLGRAQAAVAPDQSILVDPTHTTYVALKLATVPQTIIVNPDGIVTSARAGVLDAATEGSILRELSVR